MRPSGPRRFRPLSQGAVKPRLRPAFVDRASRRLKSVNHDGFRSLVESHPHLSCIGVPGVCYYFREDCRNVAIQIDAEVLERTLAFHISGHVMHSIFWQNLSPKGGGKPTGELAAAIDKNFGSFDSFKTQLNKTAATIQGSGWAALYLEPLTQQLIIGSVHDHQQSVFQGSLPLMVVDAWEHAFYLQYVNEKVKFFDALWNIWNWADIGQRYAAAKGVSLSLKGATG